MLGTAGYQEDADLAHGFPGKGHGSLLQGTMDAVSQCAGQRTRRPEGALGSEEARAVARKGAS